MQLTREKIISIREVANTVLADSEKLVNLDEILSQNNIALRMSPKENIKTVLAQLGQDVGDDPSGALLRNISIDAKDKHTILISEEMHEKYPQRTTFTVAHELGHFFLHEETSGAALMRTDNIFYNSEEREHEVEADQFAAELLIPFDKIKLIINMLNDVYSFNEKVSTISKIFNVSFSSARHRYLDVLEEINA